ncbi:MAG: hypothetical protein R2874_06550 [Desulfobacterales bacterium]
MSRDSRNLLVVDRSENMDKILRLVSVFDTDVFDRVDYRFYPLRYSDVEEMVKPSMIFLCRLGMR